MTAIPATRGEPDLLRILGLFEDAERDLKVRLDTILARGPEWFREEARLRGLVSHAQSRMRDLRDSFDERTVRAGLAEIYRDGATLVQADLAQPFGWSQAHVGAVARIASDTFEDLLTATRFVDDAAKQLIRQAAQLRTGRKLLEGQTAIQAGNALARNLRETGIGVVTYRNGARHGVGEYSRMVMRTKTAVAYNMGTLNFSAAAGVKWFEILDGSDCGLTFHEDPTLANTLIVDGFTAAAYPIAHPNCRRTFAPRPDLSDRGPENAVSRFPSTTEGQRADQAAFEKFLREQKQGKPRGRTTRTTRTPKTPRTPRTPRAAVKKPTPVRPPRPTPTRPAAPPARGPAPGADRVSSRVSYEGKAAEKYERLVDELDKLHGWGDQLPPVVVRTGNGSRGGNFGHFDPYAALRPVKLRQKSTETRAEFLERRAAAQAEKRGSVEVKIFERAGDHRELTFLHEMGHRFDWGGTNAYFSNSTGSTLGAMADPAIRDAMLGFLRAVNDSDAWQKLLGLGNTKYGRYARKPYEVWARAYAQWSADQIGGSARAQLVKWVDDVAGSNGTQWVDADFAKVGEAVEAVLRARGMMT